MVQSGTVVVQSLFRVVQEWFRSGLVVVQYNSGAIVVQSNSGSERFSRGSVGVQ